MTAPITVGSNIIVDIKKAIVGAFRAALGDIEYPDAEAKGISISMDYPLEENSYPHLWVNFSFTKLQEAGIGHRIWSGSTIKREWQFEGIVTLNVHALSSKSRDILSSQLLQMLAFRDLNPVAAQFDTYLNSKPNIHLTINRDSLQIKGQSTTFGTPWSDSQLSYEDGYAFILIGQIESTYTTTPEILKKITIIGDNLTGEGGDLEMEINSTDILPGTWV
jgi:hypothetical protein